jgi:hypothetical protein
VMTVTLKDVDNRDLWSVDIDPVRTRDPVSSWRSISEQLLDVASGRHQNIATNHEQRRERKNHAKHADNNRR